MTAPTIHALSLTVRPTRLSRDSFAPFGWVIQNPAHVRPTTGAERDSSLPALQPVEANQGTALKYADVSHLVDFYGRAWAAEDEGKRETATATRTRVGDAGAKARVAFSLFVCKPRRLRDRVLRGLGVTGSSAEERRGRKGGGDHHDDHEASSARHGVSKQTAARVLDVSVLERHPYTAQTFIPLGLARGSTRTRYLVIVAPTLPAAADAFIRASGRPAAHDTRRGQADAETDALQPRGTGMPDLARASAFWADGSQAVTYAPGTWHAPMVVVGERAVDFVVVQYVNGVPGDDCQEVFLRPQEGEGEGVSVVVEDGAGEDKVYAKL